MSLQSSSVGVEQWSAHVLQSFLCPLAVCRYLGIHTAKARRTWRVAHLQRNAQLAIQVGYRSSLTWNAILSSVPNFFLYAALTPWPRLLLLWCTKYEVHQPTQSKNDRPAAAVAAVLLSCWLVMSGCMYVGRPESLLKASTSCCYVRW